MNKDQLQFLVSGVLFGFLIGYLIAYAVHEPRVVGRAAPVPAAGNMGMSGGPAGGPATGGTGAAGETAAGLPPGHPDTSGAGGDQMMNMIFEEINALKEAVAKDPKDTRALVRLANLYHDAGKYDQAVDLYRKALDLTPDDVNARTDMGICLRELGKPDDAIAEFRKSLNTDPRHWQSWLNLGVVNLFDKQDVAAAAEAFAKVEEFNPTFKDLPLLKEAIRKARESGSRKTS